MTRFEEVERLKELEQRVPHFTQCEMHLLYPDGDEAVCFRSDFGNVTDDWMIADDLAAFFNDLRNAAPLLLDIAGQIRLGDKERFADLANDLESENWKKYEDEVELLRRYQKMAEKMNNWR